MPRYETDADLANEMAAIEQWLPNFKNYQAVKLGQYDLDFEIHRASTPEGKFKKLCCVEVKCYNVPHNKYPIQVLSLIKLRKLQAEAKKIRTFLVCRYSDGVILYIDATRITGEIGMFSRKNQREGNTNDTEMCIRIPKSNFIKQKP